MNCLEKAAELVHGDRQRAYGHPSDDFSAVSAAAKALGVDPQSGPLHHALYMVLVKVQRLVQTPDHHDSIVDGAGYFRTYEMVLEKKEYIEPDGPVKPSERWRAKNKKESPLTEGRY